MRRRRAPRRSSRQRPSLRARSVHDPSPSPVARAYGTAAHRAMGGRRDAPPPYPRAVMTRHPAKLLAAAREGNRRAFGPAAVHGGAWRRRRPRGRAPHARPRRLGPHDRVSRGAWAATLTSALRRRHPPRRPRRGGAGHRPVLAVPGRRHPRRSGAHGRARPSTSACSSARWRPEAILGGSALATPEAIRVLDATGHERILVETVGVGRWRSRWRRPPTPPWWS